MSDTRIRTDKWAQP